MCLPLVGCVLTVDGETAEVELRGDGGVATVSLMLCPNVEAGQYVLIDRGLVLEAIDAAQAEQLLQFYEELGGMWDDAEPEVGVPAMWTELIAEVARG